MSGWVCDMRLVSGWMSCEMFGLILRSCVRGYVRGKDNRNNQVRTQSLTVSQHSSPDEGLVN